MRVEGEGVEVHGALEPDYVGPLVDEPEVGGGGGGGRGEGAGAGHHRQDVAGP